MTSTFSFCEMKISLHQQLHKWAYPYFEPIDNYCYEHVLYQTSVLDPTVIIQECGPATDRGSSVTGIDRIGWLIALEQARHASWPSFTSTVHEVWVAVAWCVFSILLYRTREFQDVLATMLAWLPCNIQWVKNIRISKFFAEQLDKTCVEYITWADATQRWIAILAVFYALNMSRIWVNLSDAIQMIIKKIDKNYMQS